MDRSSGFSRLPTAESRHEEHVEESDPADMGTAFGLDASMGQVAVGTPEVPPSSAGSPPDLWERRIIRRSGL